MIEELLKEKGYELGFCQIGYTDARPFQEYGKHLKKLLKDGKYPPFVTREVDLRITPKLILKDCKSIISVAMSYKEKMKIAQKYPPSREEGYITPSAWGVDYHVLLKEAMDELINFVHQITDYKHNFSSFVDTGYLSDREVAKRAGIGYVGKNTALITKCSGSYVWLGYILTDLMLVPDEEQINLCGSCDLCIKGCPTGAIAKDGTINYRKCLANALIQKGELAQEIIDKIGNRIYGCDNCQTVCPKNREILASLDTESNETGWLPYQELKSLSNREFKRKYGYSAFSWRGKQVLLRNALLNKDSNTSC